MNTLTLLRYIGIAILYSSAALADSKLNMVVPVSPEIWRNNGSRNTNHPPCTRCCIYQNRHYSEGAILKVEGGLLQCVRDENTLGTNNLIWQLLNQRSAER